MACRRPPCSTRNDLPTSRVRASASIAKRSAAGSATRRRKRLRCIMALADSRPWDASAPPLRRASTSSGASVVEAQDDGAIADGAGKTPSAAWGVGANEDRMARRADYVAAGRIMLGEEAREGQHDRIQALPLDVAAGVGRWARNEASDVIASLKSERRTIEWAESSEHHSMSGSAPALPSPASAKRVAGRGQGAGRPRDTSLATTR